MVSVMRWSRLRLMVLGLAAVVATVGIAFVVDGLRDSSHLQLLFGAVVTVLAAIWAATASRSRSQ